MKYNSIEIVTVDEKGFETDRRDFDTVKEAKAFVKKTAMRSDYWEQHAESLGWHIGNVNEFQLHCDGEYLEGWYPKWAKPQPVETDSTY